MFLLLFYVHCNYNSITDGATPSIFVFSAKESTTKHKAIFAIACFMEIHLKFICFNIGMSSNFPSVSMYSLNVSTVFNLSY